MDAFLAASRGGDLEALLAVLDPDVVRADPTAVASATANAAPGGRPKALFEFTVSDGRVVALEIIADAERIAATEVVLLS